MKNPGLAQFTHAHRCAPAQRVFAWLAFISSGFTIPRSIRFVPSFIETDMIHPWHDVTPGENIPQEYNAIVEIPFGSSVKY